MCGCANVQGEYRWISLCVKKPPEFRVRIEMDTAGWRIMRVQ